MMNENLARCILQTVTHDQAGNQKIQAAGLEAVGIRKASREVRVRTGGLVGRPRTRTRTYNSSGTGGIAVGER